MWPSTRRGKHVHSRYRRYNDPYSTRQYIPYYSFDNYHDVDRYNDSGSVGDGFGDADDDGMGLLAWHTLMSDVQDFLTPNLQDPWESINILTQSGVENLEAVISPEFLSEMHNEITELGADVVSELKDILDEGAAIFDKVNEISETISVPIDALGRQLDSAVSEIFDMSALESTLDDIPDYEGDADMGNIDTGGDDYGGIPDADDAANMYAGAGPRDLDDGGPSYGGCGNAALAGARRRARTRKVNRKLIRAIDKSNRNLSGYRRLTLNRDVDAGGKEVEYPWPRDVKLRWITETREKQIEAMAQSDLLQLPDVVEEIPKLLLEWTDNAEDNFEADLKIDVVLVTQCSLDRLPNLQAQLARWANKASVAIYLKPDECSVDAEEAITTTIKAARDEAEEAQRDIGRFDVAVTIVEGSVFGEPYPINYLRNVALLEARRQHLRFHDSLDKSAVLLVDVDFRPSVNLNEILHAESAAQTILDCHRVVVCPAFECTAPVCPRSMSELKNSFEKGEIEGFHLSHFPQGHGPTRFQRFWTESLQFVEGTEISSWQNCYEVQYEKLFEPYIVMASRDVPLYDERFQGYGLNKVLPGVFLVAPAHSRSESWAERYGSKSDETRFNQLLLKGLYHNFMTGLTQGREAIVSDQTKAKQCLQGLQELECQRRREKASSTVNLKAPVRQNLRRSLATNYSRD
jgi:Glycosyl-transferase for dystroglycan